LLEKLDIDFFVLDADQFDAVDILYPEQFIAYFACLNGQFRVAE